MARRGGGVTRFLGGQAQISRGALYLLFATAGISLVYLVSSDEVRARMLYLFTATGDSVWRRGRFWQVATSPLLEVSFISLLFQAFTLWLFLPALERWWGMRRFLFFALYTSVFGATVGTLVGWLLGPPWSGTPLAGLDPFVFGGIVAYGVLFAQQPVQFFGVLPMTGRQLTWGIIAFTGLFVVLGQEWARGAGMASAMLLAWFLTSDRASVRLWILKSKQRRLRRRAHLRVVEDQDKKKRWMN